MTYQVHISKSSGLEGNNKKIELNQYMSIQLIRKYISEVLTLFQSQSTFEIENSSRKPKFYLTAILYITLF